MFHTHVVKRRGGHTEPYDNHKVYASCYAACVSVHLPKEKAEEISAMVTDDLDKWIDAKDQVASEEVFKRVTKALALYNKEAAVFYETYRDVS